MMRTDLIGGPFDSVLDVGGNVGDFAAQCRAEWPRAHITSFEPIHFLADANRENARGRWWVETVAISDREGEAMISYNRTQHSASTMMEIGPARAMHFGLRDKLEPLPVVTRTLDSYAHLVDGRCLLKVDVEGHEREVLNGALEVLQEVETVIIEVQNDPTIFLDSPPAEWVDYTLRNHGLSFHGIADSFHAPGGRVLQFDGVWRRIHPL